MENSPTYLHNPEVGYEKIYGFINKEKKPKRVFVIGGGLAGMETTYVLAKKEYDVKLIEKDEQLGGSAKVASVLNEKKEFSRVVDHRLRVPLHTSLPRVV